MSNPRSAKSEPADFANKWYFDLAPSLEYVFDDALHAGEG